ncbi:MAG: hypothetical protein EP329_15605 [Deltaproteobacteria bacterium]|nr:MAG: hypothetical protein EP329_15605 [Deltaproteobacteria bacterium]
MRRITTIAAALVLAGSFGACSSDSGSNDSDTSTTTDTTVVGDTTTTDSLAGDTAIADTDLPDIPMTAGTVKALQGEALVAGCDGTKILTINPEVTLTDVVVTTPKYDAYTPDDNSTGTGLDGYFVADQDGGDYSGMVLVVARDGATDFKPGDVIDVAGQLVEYYCNTQIEATTVPTVKSTIAAPEPLVVAAAEVGTEAHEGMLVKVEGVTVSEKVTGGYLVTDGLKIGFGLTFFTSMDVGATYDVTGVVNYAYGEFQLRPRTAADLKKQGGGTASAITDIQGSSDSTACTASSIQNLTSGLELEGVIASAKIVVSTSGNGLDGYFLSDGTQNDYSGILVTVPATQATNFAVGDNVKVSGKHTEFYCMTEFGADVIEATSGTLTAPAAVALTSGMAAADLEKYEGMLVTFSNVTVTGVTDYNESQTDAGVLIDKYAFDATFTAPVANTVLTSVTGFLTYGFSNYRVSPRSAADIVAQ